MVHFYSIGFRGPALEEDYHRAYTRRWYTIVFIIKIVQSHLVGSPWGIGSKNIFRCPFSSLAVINIQSSPRGSILRI